MIGVLLKEGERGEWRKEESGGKDSEGKRIVKESGSEKRNRMNGEARIEYILRIARGRRFDGKDIKISIYHIYRYRHIYIKKRNERGEKSDSGIN